MLEQKFSVIFKELGVDKYSDVLDSEVAELDFAEVYMNSIGRFSSVERNMYPVESEVKQQVANAQKYKDIIREEATGHIGIENIRRSRLAKLAREKASIEAEYKKGS